MGTVKRSRQKEGRQSRVEAARAAAARVRRRRLSSIAAAVLVVAVLGAGIAVAVTGGDGGGDEEVTAGDSTSTTATTTTEAPTTTVPLEDFPIEPPPPGESINGPTPCPPNDGSATRTTRFTDAPPECIDRAFSYTAEVITSVGPFTIALNHDVAPQATNNFVVLARYHFYDGVPFHRIIPGFVVQGGGQGPDLRTGGPGYRLTQEIPRERYGVGSVAMASSETEGPSGSQFFIVTGPDGEALPQRYTEFGQVTEGLDVVQAIEAVGTPEGVPTETVTIESVTIAAE